jgi:hypothetical protein
LLVSKYDIIAPSITTLTTLPSSEGVATGVWNVDQNNNLVTTYPVQVLSITTQSYNGTGTDGTNEWYLTNTGAIFSNYPIIVLSANTQTL